MMKYRTRTMVTETGLTLSELIAQRTRHGLPVMYPDDTGEITEKEVVLKPRVFIDVWNYQISLSALFELPGGRLAQVDYPYKLPQYVMEEIEHDLWQQGGAISISGRYEILSETVHRFVESKKFQMWLRVEARNLGLEVIEEENETPS